ncbi:MAG: type II toxin-antitoxin system VapC family toxin [Spirochaetales bacterium]
MSYLVDTNILIYAKDRQHTHVIHQMEQVPLHDLFVSAVTVAELEYGAAKSQSPERARTALSGYLLPFTIIPFTDDDAEAFGVIRATLEKKGLVIGPYDMLIASQAIARDLTLVTNDVREFQRVPGLRCVNWAASPGHS